VSATVAGSTETYTYDGDGTRVSRTVGGDPPVQYDVDRSGPLAVTLDDGNRKYVYGQGLAYAVAGSSVEIYHDDRLGTVRAPTDLAGGITATYDNDEWGRPTAATGGSSQPLRFTGEPTDASGLTYLRTRYYSPDLGRFLSRDTWPGVPTMPQTQSRYAYVANNPTTATDPSGRVLDTLADAAFILYDIGGLIFGPEKDRAMNWLALGADLGGAALPFVTGAGAALRAGFRAADHVDDAIGPIRYLDDAAAAACSFTPETLVSTPDGAVPISTIRGR
jgi:RHS repeat-associated protein